MALTKDQQNAYEFIKECYNNGERYAVLTGQAGTGKTYLTNKIFNDIFSGLTAGITVSHKAKNILSKSIESSSIDIMTYAKAMGKAQDYDTETGIALFKRMTDPKIFHKNYFVDECSMFSDEMENEFEEEVKNVSYLNNYFILYVGDHHQLPAIDNSEIEFSNLFNKKNLVSLNEIVRQEKDNPIRKLSKLTADCIDGDKKIKSLLRHFIDDYSHEKNQGVLFTNNQNDITETYCNFFKSNVKFGDVNKIVIIAYRNKTINMFNREVRAKLGFVNEYEKGDIIMANSNFKINEDEFIQNGEEFWVEKVERDVIEGIPTWKLHCIRNEIDNTTKVILPVVVHEYMFMYKKKINELVEQMKESKKKGFFKKQIKKFSEQFCYVQYAHAITAYKSQGSTIDTVLFDMKDVIDTTKINELRKLQSIYVAITRAKNRIIINH